VTSEFDIPQGAIGIVKLAIEQGDEERALKGLKLLAYYVDAIHGLAHNIAQGKAPRARNAMVGETLIVKSDHFLSLYRPFELALRDMERFISSGGV
jgi:hypothetical protein